MLLDAWAEGARRRVRGTNPLVISRFQLVRIEAIDVTLKDGTRPSRAELFDRRITDFDHNRSAQPNNPALHPGYADPDGEKAAVLKKLKGRFVHTEKLKRQNIILVFHGVDHAAAEAICNYGFEHLNYTDAGWFGTGTYATTYAEYACQYATGQHKSNANPAKSKGEHVLLACWATPGMCYPI
mmetsp:Transcript_3581/g.11103  ORF Transcript_3581/g.11103 Transcript_3581/m.11103 type:complete len:183 (+) Transcript_3581:828-1376(+)